MDTRIFRCIKHPHIIFDKTGRFTYAETLKYTECDFVEDPHLEIEDELVPNAGNTNPGYYVKDDVCYYTLGYRHKGYYPVRAKPLKKESMEIISHSDNQISFTITKIDGTLRIEVR